MKLFSVKLKSIVAYGLLDIFIACLLLVRDLFQDKIVNGIIVLWLWFLFYFMCNSYRFVSIIINLIIIEKKKVIQNVEN